MPSAEKTIKSRFEALDQKRNPVLFRAREFAELSIPGIMPREGMSETSELPVPFSAATARGISRLASRLVSTVDPLNNIPFFSLELDDAVPIEGQDPTPEQVILNRIERRIMKKIGTTNLRAALFSAFQHLQVIGNVLLEVQDNYNVTVCRLDNYVIRRRPDGEWHEIIYRNWVDPSMLPEMLTKEGFTDSEDESAQAEPMFTRVISDHKGGCSIQREFRDKKFGDYTYTVCPYIPLGWNLISGENYHRGLVEENLGDIRAIEVMAEALLDSIAANSEWRFGVNPAGITEIHDLQDSVNGAFVPAAKDDVFPIQLGNQAQVAAAQASVTLKEQTLGQVFLLNSAVQPQGDRVTATMVKVIANELEQALGGVFSDIARSLQLPLVRRIMYMMLNDGILLPESDPATAKMKAALEEPDGVLSIKVRTGLEALNREVENEKMGQIMQVLTGLPQPAQEAIIWPGMLNRFVSTFGVEPKGIIYTVQEQEQRTAQAQQMQAEQARQEQALQTTGAIAENAAAQ